MNTPTPDRDDAAEGPVHDLLWRLRARLVTPPAEDRVDADLDRLFAAAREHAHLAPRAEVEGRDAALAPAALAAEDLPQVVHLRGYRMVDRVGRVAAAFVLVAAVGGAVVMRPGLDGQTGVPSITGQGASEDRRLTADAGESGAIDLTIDDVDLVPEVDEDVDADPSSDSSTGSSSSTDAVTPSAPPASSTSRGSTSTSGGGSTAPAPTASPSPTATPSEPAPTTSPKPSEQPSEDAGDPEGFDGFGGGRLCPEPTPSESDEGVDRDEARDEAEEQETSSPPSCLPKPKPSEDPEDDATEETGDAETEDEASPTSDPRSILPSEPPARSRRG